MPSRRGENLEKEITTLVDAMLFAENIKELDLSTFKEKLEKIENAFTSGSWSLAEKKLQELEHTKSEDWYVEFVGKRKAALEKSGTNRFKNDGLCKKYGHHMIKVRLSNVRWYYVCNFCGKQGKKASIG